MARYTGPSWKQSRRLKFSVLENGKELQKRNYAPGQHGQRRAKLSEYALQLQEKQKVKNLYGLSEKQFRKTYEAAGKKKGVHGTNLLVMLESRLDNIVYRLGLAKTRKAARQVVNHGHILVNGKKVNIPSYQVKPGQTVEMKEASRNLQIVKEALENCVARLGFVSFDETKGVGTYVRLPQRSEILPEIRENLIVEFYNR